MDEAWLNRKITEEELESGATGFDLDHDKLDIYYRPYGNREHHDVEISEEELNNLKAQMQEGDELWIFNSPQEFWSGLCGRRGLCIIRDGEEVDSVLTLMG